MQFKLFLCFLSFLHSSGPVAPGESYLKKMHDRYHGKWYQDFTFDQDTKMYNNDTLKKTQLWHEAMHFPDLFRIDFGPKDSASAVIFRSDSAYRFQNGKLKSVRFYENDLLYLLGGMYYHPFNEVVEKIRHFGYDLAKGHEDNWKGKKVYVIGADKGEERVNQLWIDASTLNLVRMINIKDGQKHESLFEDHIKLGGGYTETTSIFYIDGKMIQHEKYHNCRSNVKLDKRFFEPKDFGKYYWFN